MKLPSLPNKTKPRRIQEVAFGGVNYSENFNEGEWEATRNISCALFPTIIPRAGRNVVSQEDGATAVYVFDKLAKVVGTTFYWDGVPKGTVSPGKKQFAKVGDILCIFPDGAFFNVVTGEFESTESTVIIPNRESLAVEGSTITIYSGGGINYHRTENGETITGRGQIGSKSSLEAKAWVSSYPDGVPQLTPLNQVDTYPRTADFYQADYVFPFYGEDDSDYKYNSYQAINLTSEEKEFWPGVRRTYWTLTYGVPFSSGSDDMVAVGTISGWEEMTQQQYSECAADINRVSVVSGQSTTQKYLNELKVNDKLSETHVDNYYTKRVVETIDRVQYIDYALEHTTSWGDPNSPSKYKSYKIHYYYTGITTGIYEGVNNGTPLNIPGDLNDADIDEEGVSVVISRGETSIDATFDSVSVADNVTTITFLEDISALASEMGPITIQRVSGAFGFEYITASGNRLWAVKGDRIYASKWGDPTDFESSTGTQVDPWSTQISSDGEWTGIIEYSGNVLCFKEDMLHMVIGTLPENYRCYDYNVAGIKKGCAESAVIINEVLYYYGIEGVYRYSGNVPTLITQNFGLRVYNDAVAGSDGIRYYISAKGDSWDMHVYDTVKGIWMREDELEVIQFARYLGKLYALTTDGRFIMLGNGDMRSIDTSLDGDETYFAWSMKSTPFYEDTFNRKYHTKLIIRMEMFPFSSFSVSVSYDGGDDMEIFRSQVSTGHRVMVVPVLPRRCDAFRLKIEGTGNFILRGIAREYSEGREY